MGPNDDLQDRLDESLYALACVANSLGMVGTSLFKPELVADRLDEAVRVLEANNTIVAEQISLGHPWTRRKGEFDG